MQLLCKLAIAISLAAAPLCGAFAQNGQTDGNPALVTVADKKQTNKSHRPTSPRLTKHGLTKNDRKSLIAVALHGRVRGKDDSDCSHLVHAIYEIAGFPYEYAPSDDLYAGVASFQRVKAPLAGDLVVWRGHVGMVIKPSKHTFFSSLSSGPGTDDYKSTYWEHRGQPRFFRYIKKESSRSVD
jgi:hypothetical protein